MKKLFKILTLSSIAISMIVIVSCNKDDNSPIAAAKCLPSNLQNGVIAAYTFGNGSLNDSSGNGYHLTNPTSAYSDQDRAGNSNCAFHFIRSNNDFLTRSNATFLDGFLTQDFSISLWYKNENPSLVDFELLIGRDDGFHCPNTNGQWSLALYDLKKPTFGMDKFSINWNSNPVNAIPVDQPQWRHLVITSSGLNFRLFLNGVETSTFTSGPCGPNSQDLGDLFLGKYFEGLLDDVIIYNRILTVNEITQLYNLPACCM